MSRKLLVGLSANVLLLTALYVSVTKLVMHTRMTLFLVAVSFALAVVSVIVLFKRPETRDSIIFKFWEK